MNTREAAAFCGYSTSYFEKMVREFKITRYGPRRTRFARADLESFMANPDDFRVVDKTPMRKPIMIEV